MTNERGIRAGKAFIELSVVDKAKKVLANIRGQLQQFSKDAIEVSNKAATAAAAILAPLTAATKQFISLGDQLLKASTRIRSSVSDLATLKAAAEQNDVSFNGLVSAIFRMDRRIGNAKTATGPAVRALNELGIAAEEFGKLAPIEKLYQLADRLRVVDDEARRNQLGFELFGDNFRELVPLLSQGSRKIKELQLEAKKLGFAFTGVDAKQQAENAADLADTFLLLKNGVQAVAVEVGAALFGSVKKGANAIRELVGNLIQWIRNNREMIRTVARIGVQLLALAASLRVVGTAAAAISMLGKSTMLLRTSMVALVAVNIAGWMVNSTSAMQDLNAEFSRAIDLTSQLSKLYDKRFAGRLEAIKKETDLETKLAKIAEYKAELEKRKSGSVIQRNEAQQRIRDAHDNRSMLQSIGSVIGINPNDTAADQRLLEEANGRIRQVTNQIEELGKEALRAKINVAELNTADRDSLRKRALSAIPGAERGQVAFGISSLGLKVNDPQKISNDLNKKQLETLNDILDELRGSHDGRFMLVR